MAQTEIDDPGDNAFTNGVLNKVWMGGVCDRLNRKFKILSPPWLAKKFKWIPTDDDITLDLTGIPAGGAGSSVTRLKLSNATVGGVAKVRVSLGFVAGRKADSSMDDPDDDPEFIVTLTSTAAVYYVYCDVTVAYSTTTGIWTSSGCEITMATTVPANSATHIFIPLGTATVDLVSVGVYNATEITQIVSGDQWVARTGNATTYVDANGLI